MSHIEQLIEKLQRTSENIETMRYHQGFIEAYEVFKATIEIMIEQYPDTPVESLVAIRKLCETTIEFRTGVIKRLSSK